MPTHRTIHAFSFLFILLLLLSNYAPISAQATIQQTIQDFVNYEPMRYASLSFCALEVETGKEVASHQPNMSLVPASTMKAVTTATALGVLGHSYTYQTRLQYDGNIKNGVLNGNIYITGTGDPTLGSHLMPNGTKLEELMQQMVDKIAARGIKKVNGLVIGDGSHFTTAMPAPDWQWNDIGNYYGAGAAGLNIHENLYYLTFQQKLQLNAIPSIANVSPAMPYLTFINEIRSDRAGTGDNAFIFGAPNSTVRYLRGTIPVGRGQFKIKGAIPDPAHFAAYSLIKALEASGIETNKMAKNIFEYRREGKDQRLSRTTIMKITSQPVSQIIKRTNEKSVNLYAEALLKAMGKRKKGEGSTEKGVEAVKDFWTQRGMDMEGFFMEDGSGLSPRNGVTSYQLTQIMRKSAKDKGIYKHFYNSLALGGRTGTARYMFRGSKAAGRVRLKSGSMRRVRAYTGYVNTRSGKLVAFTIIANNFMGESKDIRKKMEKVIEAIYFG